MADSGQEEQTTLRTFGAALLVAAAVVGAAVYLSHRPTGSAVSVPRMPLAQAVIPNDMLNVADPKMGEKVIQLCTACHSLKPEGEPGKVGPSLYAIVGAPIARRADYDYSDGLKRLRGRIWTTDALYEWLHDPAGFAPGTKMMFNGLLDPQDRMDLISYLITLH